MRIRNSKIKHQHAKAATRQDMTLPFILGAIVLLSALVFSFSMIQSASAQDAAKSEKPKSGAAWQAEVSKKDADKKDAGQKTANAETKPEAPAIAPDNPVVKQINDYFNSFKHLEGTFIQTDSANKQSKGRFYVQRPGRIRFDYQPPSKMRIVADGEWLSIEDKALKTYDKYPLELTPFKILLDKTVDLGRNARIVDLFEGDDLIIVTVKDKSDDDSGRIKLFFSRKDFKLTEWIITDPQGLDTRIQIADLQQGKQKRRDFFYAGDVFEEPTNN